MNAYRKHSVKFNFLMNFLLKTSGALCAAVSYPFVFRALGAERIGTVSFAMSVSNLFTMFASLGVPTYGVRECARVRDDRNLLSKTVAELLIIQTVMTSISVVVLMCVVYAVPRLYKEPILFAIQGFMIFTNCFGAEWLFAGLEQYGYIAFRTAVTKVTSIFLILLLVRNKDDYLVYAALLALATILSNLWNLISLRHYVNFETIRGRTQCRKHMAPVLVFFAQTVAITVYTSLDSTMLGFLKNDYWVGIYDAAIKIKLVLTYFITSLGTVLLPRLSYFVRAGENEAFKKGISKSLEFTLITAIPLAVFFSVEAQEIILILFGQSFLPSTAVLQILMPTIVLIGLSTITGTQILIPIGKENIAMYSYIMGAITDLALNFVLIPHYAAEGAAWGTLVAECVVLGVQIVFLRKVTDSVTKKQKMWRPLVATFLSTAVLLKVRQMILLQDIQRVMLDICIYWGGVVLILVLTGEPLISEQLKRLKTMKKLWFWQER